jgi:chromosome segregation ATPase
MTDAPEKIFADKEFGHNDWDAGTFCTVNDGGTEYTRTDISQDKINEKDERIEELEAACEVVSQEFEGDLWTACRKLLTKAHFDFSGSYPDGVQVEEFEGHMNETLFEFDRAEAKIAELENALAAASGTIAAMRDNVAAGQARNAQLQDTLQDIASTGVGWTVQAARDALKSKPW